MDTRLRLQKEKVELQMRIHQFCHLVDKKMAAEIDHLRAQIPDAHDTPYT
jgi:hypothetical protein